MDELKDLATVVIEQKIDIEKYKAMIIEKDKMIEYLKEQNMMFMLKIKNENIPA